MSGNSSWFTTMVLLAAIVLGSAYHCSRQATDKPRSSQMDTSVKPLPQAPNQQPRRTTTPLKLAPVLPKTWLKALSPAPQGMDLIDVVSMSSQPAMRHWKNLVRVDYERVFGSCAAKFSFSKVARIAELRSKFRYFTQRSGASTSARYQAVATRYDPQALFLCLTKAGRINPIKQGNRTGYRLTATGNTSVYLIPLTKVGYLRIDGPWFKQVLATGGPLLIGAPLKLVQPNRFLMWGRGGLSGLTELRLAMSFQSGFLLRARAQFASTSSAEQAHRAAVRVQALMKRALSVLEFQRLGKVVTVKCQTKPNRAYALLLAVFGGSGPRRPPPAVGPATLPTLGRWDCVKDKDCLNSCRFGAINRTWFQKHRPKTQGCMGGCTNQISAPPRCENRSCVAYDNTGRKRPYCTRIIR